MGMLVELADILNSQHDYLNVWSHFLRPVANWIKIKFFFINHMLLKCEVRVCVVRSNGPALVTTGNSEAKRCSGVTRAHGL
jgi:hypothetical protein